MKDKHKEKIIQQGYDIEVLTDEVEDLERELAETKAKLWEVICHNDRLTLTYEPYRPPGDEYEDVGFYDLIEENESLTEKLLDKIEVIKELEEHINSLEVALTCTKPAPEIPTRKKNELKYDRYWNLSFELWPAAWGLNYYRFNWQKHQPTSGVREGSLQLGPIGFAWNREPKRK